MKCLYTLVLSKDTSSLILWRVANISLLMGRWNAAMNGVCECISYLAFVNHMKPSLHCYIPVSIHWCYCKECHYIVVFQSNIDIHWWSKEGSSQPFWEKKLLQQAIKAIFLTLTIKSLDQLTVEFMRTAKELLLKFQQALSAMKQKWNKKFLLECLSTTGQGKMKKWIPFHTTGHIIPHNLSPNLVKGLHIALTCLLHLACGEISSHRL